jgi:putative oxidoreductase
MASTAARRFDIALAFLRIAIGIVFVAHGAQKLFVFGFAGVGGFFAQLGVPAPTMTGPFIGLLEFAGGIALVVGLLARLAALGLACDMVGAIVLVHLKNGFFLPKGLEFAMVLCVSNVAIALAGAGAFSLDALIAGRRSAAVD